MAFSDKPTLNCIDAALGAAGGKDLVLTGRM